MYDFFGLGATWLLHVAEAKFTAGQMFGDRLEDDGYTGIGQYCILRVISFSPQVPLGLNCL